jgi:hypothetical protein
MLESNDKHPRPVILLKREDSRILITAASEAIPLGLFKHVYDASIDFAWSLVDSNGIDMV